MEGRGGHWTRFHGRGYSECGTGVALGPTQPADWIVLAAAYTDVDGCETHRDLAFDVNCRGAVNVARATKQQRARLLFLSTPTTSSTARRRLLTTLMIPAHPAASTVNRKLRRRFKLGRFCRNAASCERHGCSAPGECFPDTILTGRQPATAGSSWRPAGSPTYAVDLARALIQLCRKEASGVVHATNRGQCSWYEFAREIIARAGLDTAVRETTSEKFMRPAERPKYSVLSPESLERRGIAMPGWQDALQRYLAERGFS